MQDLQATDADAKPPARTGRVQLHPLRYLYEAEEVTIGRLATSTYVVLPPDGAELVRQLEAGLSIERAGSWYLRTYGEQLDVADFVDGLADLGFVCEQSASQQEEPRVRWQRLAGAVFSPLGLACYLALLGGAVAVTLKHPSLLPQPRNLFFSSYLSLVLIVLLVGQLPLLLLHEAGHALAGRRLGLPSTLSVGRRMIYVVLQTNLDGLVIVPRRQRYLPILAGIMVDAGVVAALSLTAACIPTGSGGAIRLFLLAMAYLTCLRIVWQFWVFLETDIYHLVATVFGCLDLQAVARLQLSNWYARAVGGRPRHDPELWHPRDRRAAAPYAVLVAAGYALCLIMVPLNVIPATSRMVSIFRSQLSAAGSDRWLRTIDAVLFLFLMLSQFVLAGWLARRERISRRLRPTKPAAG